MQHVFAKLMIIAYKDMIKEKLFKMKVGISVRIPDATSGYERYGEKKYLKLREHGYEAIDIDISDTTSFLYTEPFGVEDIEKGKAEETWALNLEFMRKLLVTAKEEDVIICLENMPMLKFSLSTPEQILKFVKEIDDEHFKICLDTGHVSVFYELDLADEVRRLGDYIKVLHVHDNKWRIDCHMYPYFGRIDWEGFGKALKEINYGGTLSLETLPPRAQPDELYEKSAVFLCNLGKNICKDL